MCCPMYPYGRGSDFPKSRVGFFGSTRQYLGHLGPPLVSKICLFGGVAILYLAGR